MILRYKPLITAKAFHASDAYFKGLSGPHGSGKSTAMVMEMFYRAIGQPPAVDAVRYTRWGVVWPDYQGLLHARELIMSLMPRGSGSLSKSGEPLKGVFDFMLSDNSSIWLEFEMWSAKTAEESLKFQSSNWTGCWIGDAADTSFDVVMTAMSCVRRFPTRHTGACLWGGVIMNFGHPEIDHWLNSFFSGQGPESALQSYPFLRNYPKALFRQPPAAFRVERDGEVFYELNQQAENLINLPGGADFYARQIAALRNQGRLMEIETDFCMVDPVSE